MMKITWMMLGLFGLGPALLAQPSISTVLNAASYDAAISPGCWATVFGSGLAGAAFGVSAAPLPTILGGVNVTVNGVAAELLYVSPTQINLVIPEGLVIPDNTVVPLIVTSDGASSKAYNIRLLPYAPAIFTLDGSGSGPALAFEGNLPATTVSPGDTLTIYATGVGEDFEVYLGERGANVILARRAQGFSGFYRIDVTVPVLATDRLYLRAGGWQSNITTIGIQGGTNVPKATGSIDGVSPSADPSNGPGTSFGLMLYAGRFSTSLDIAPSAGPFDIAATGDGGAAILSIDPTASCTNDAGVTSQGSYTASLSTITADGARGDFSGSIFPLWDYATCDPATWVCLAFPLSTVPMARLSPWWAAALGALPLANTLTSAGANGVAQALGCLQDLMSSANGTHIAIDAQNNASFSVFGGFQQLALGTSNTRMSTFALYVDGVKIASKKVSFAVPYRH